MAKRKLPTSIVRFAKQLAGLSRAVVDSQLGAGAREGTVRAMVDSGASPWLVVSPLILHKVWREIIELDGRPLCYTLTTPERLRMYSGDYYKFENVVAEFVRGRKTGTVLRAVTATAQRIWVRPPPDALPIPAQCVEINGYTVVRLRRNETRSRRVSRQ